MRDLSCGDKRVYLAFFLRRVFCSRCDGVKNEGLDWLADNPLYTKRFAFYVGRRCRETTIREVAEELHLDWHAVKDLEKQYMREQLRRAGTPPPRVIGIDEISIGKGPMILGLGKVRQVTKPDDGERRRAVRDSRGERENLGKGLVYGGKGEWE